MKYRWNRVGTELKEMIAGKKIFSIFIPVLLWGDLFEAQAADTRRTYRPTAAQLRLEEQYRLQAARIREIRRRQAAQTAQTGQTTQPVQAAQTAQTARRSSPVPAAAAAPQIRYIYYQSARFALVQDIARYYGMKINKDNTS